MKLSRANSDPGEGGGGLEGNSTLILVQVCRRYFFNPPYSSIRDFRNVYLLMYYLLA